MTTRSHNKSPLADPKDSVTESSKLPKVFNRNQRSQLCSFNSSFVQRGAADPQVRMKSGLKNN